VVFQNALFQLSLKSQIQSPHRSLAQLSPLASASASCFSSTPKLSWLSFMSMYRQSLAFAQLPRGVDASELKEWAAKD
jgi:hypothetical protein